MASRSGLGARGVRTHRRPCRGHARLQHPAVKHSLVEQHSASLLDERNGPTFDAVVQRLRRQREIRGCAGDGQIGWHSESVPREGQDQRYDELFIAFAVRFRSLPGSLVELAVHQLQSRAGLSRHFAAPPEAPKMRRSLMAFLVVGLVVTAEAQTKIPAQSTVFVEDMEHDLDGYIKAELIKQKVALRVVATIDEAELIMLGSATSQEKRAWHEGWLTSEQDKTAGNVTLVDKASKTMVWAGEAGDRSLWWGAMARGGHRKVASRLVKNLKKSIGPSGPAPNRIPRPSAPTEPAESGVLTNEQVISMVTAGIGDDVVIAKVRTSAARFNLEPDGLVALKKAGVSDRVLEAMVASGSTVKPQSPTPQK